jgi:hypothetical protein
MDTSTQRVQVCTCIKVRVIDNYKCVCLSFKKDFILKKVSFFIKKKYEKNIKLLFICLL